MRNWKLRHVGVPVRDLDEAVEHFQSLGFTLVPRPEVVSGSDTYRDFKMYGKAPDPPIKTRIRFVDKGSLQFELLQPLEGYSLHNEFLEAKDEGASHICFAVDDFDNEVANLNKQGMPTILSGSVANGARFVYVDARKVGGLIFELVSQQ